MMRKTVPTSAVISPALAPVSTYLSRLAGVIAALPREPIAAIAEALLAAADEGRIVYILGNGGSAATASHFVCDLAKTASVPGHARLRAIALTDNTPLLTAIGNDLAYEEVFAEQVRTFARVGDLVLAISASGNSANVIRAVTAAREVGARVVGMSGFGGGQLRALSDICLVAPSDEYGPVEDAHMIAVHAITAALRTMRGAPPAAAAPPDGAEAATLAELAELAALTDPTEAHSTTTTPQSAPSAPTVFLDRDGVLNRNRDDYVKNWDEFEFLPGARHAVARLSQAGYRVFVFTNQACIAKGLTSLAAVTDLHQRMQVEVARAGGRIEDVLLCPHHADARCACRKPNPGLLLRARDEYGVDLAQAIVIGDSSGDLQAAAAAGVPAALVLSGLGWRAARAGAADQPHVRLLARDLPHAVDLILGGSPLAAAHESMLQALVRAARVGAQLRRHLARSPRSWLPRPALQAGEIAPKLPSA